MSHPRRANKIDKNQQAIVRYLRSLPGVSVELGHDDILVGYNLLTFWFEIKSPDVISKRTGKVIRSEKRRSQNRLQRTFAGHYSIVSSAKEILDEIGFPIGGTIREI
ncbi:MAG TPA: hypothetical protein ENK38_02030 [Gammaproteobacteria bacterium]|nr:hypothetical protein [Gammaproteobacteria bacterium]